MVIKCCSFIDKCQTSQAVLGLMKDGTICNGEAVQQEADLGQIWNSSAEIRGQHLVKLSPARVAFT